MNVGKENFLAQTLIYRYFLLHNNLANKHKYCILDKVKIVSINAI